MISPRPEKRKPGLSSLPHTSIVFKKREFSQVSIRSRAIIEKDHLVSAPYETSGRLRDRSRRIHRALQRYNRGSQSKRPLLEG